MILLVLGLLMLTGCTEQLGGASSGGASKTPPTYSQAFTRLEELGASDVVAKAEKRKADENKLPRDSTAFNLAPVDSALSKARKECKKLLANYNDVAKQYNGLTRPRAKAPKGDPNLVIVKLGVTLNELAASLPYTCGEELQKPKSDQR